MILILTKEDKDSVKIDQFATSFSTKVPCQQCAGRKQGGNCQIIGSFHHLADNSPPNPAHLMMPSRNTEPKDQVKLVRVPEMFSPSPPHLFQMMKTTRFLAGLPLEKVILAKRCHYPQPRPPQTNPPANKKAQAA